MSRTACKRLWICLLAPLLSPGASFAQLATEVIGLHMGWNAVWVNLEPEPNQVDQILAQQDSLVNYQAVWTFEPNRALPGTASASIVGRWFFYDKGVPSVVNTLRTLRGHRGYLIKMNSAGQLRLTGRPLIQSSRFSGRSSNLFGAMTHAKAGPLSFEQFFSHPNAAGKIRSSGDPIKDEIFSLVSDNFVRRTLTDTIQPNAGYWLNVVQDFEYAGPVDVTSSANGLSFGKSASLRTLSIEVPASTEERRLTFQASSCAVLSATGGCSGGAQVDWLQYRGPTIAGLPSWDPLSASHSVGVPAGTTRVELELRARRAGLVLVAPPRTTAGGGVPAEETFPVVIDITDDQGSRAVVAADVSVVPIYGRWFGRVVLDDVSPHPSVGDPSLEAPASPLGMNLLLDLPSPPVPPGTAVNKILDSVCFQTHRDGRDLQRRFSSVLFDRPVDLVETVPLDSFAATGTLTGTLVILPEDPLNPYRHRYNPEHRKGYQITRVITIKIESQVVRLSDQLAGLDGTFGPHRLEGVYTEVISGLSVEPITVHGTFHLDRLVGVLCPAASAE